MKTSSAKAKGRRACQEVKDLYHKYFSDLDSKDIVVTPSGVTGPDLYFSPQCKKHLGFPVVEVKNQEKLNIWSAHAQLENHVVSELEVPILYFRKNRSKLYMSMEADKFLKLISSFLASSASQPTSSEPP